MGEEYVFLGKFSADFKSIELEHSGTFRRALMFLGDIDLEVKVKKLSRKRSDAQNRYWWGVLIVSVVRYAKERKGETISPVEAHAWILTQVLRAKATVKIVLDAEVVIFEKKRTSEMTVEEFSSAVEEVRLYFNNPDDPENIGWEIPLPTKYNFTSDFIQ